MSVIDEIPKLITGIVSFFVAVLGVRIFMPIFNVIFAQQFHNTLVLNMLKLMVFVVIFFLVYMVVIVQMFNKKKEVEA